MNDLVMWRYTQYKYITNQYKFVQRGLQVVIPEDLSEQIIIYWLVI